MEWWVPEGEGMQEHKECTGHIQGEKRIYHFEREHTMK